MAQYQIRVENDDYSLAAYLNEYQQFSFRQVLNDVARAEVTLHPNDAKIASIAVMKRLRIVRDGVTVWGGLIQRINWSVPQSAPQGETWKFYALDHAVYAQWRQCVCASGTAPTSYSDHVDDICRELVRDHMGAHAAAARQFSDVTVEADSHSAASKSCDVGFNNLLGQLQKVAALDGVDWRFVPSASGCTFTAKTLWGYDRTQGNGVNAECVFAVDRGNFRGMSYVKDALKHDNYVYIGGQGEAADREVVERSDSAAITAYKRREAFVDARQLQLTASLQARGDAELDERAVIEAAEVVPPAATWKATTGTTWDLGDLVTIALTQYDRSFSIDVKIVGLDVTVTPGGLEQVRILPETL